MSSRAAINRRGRAVVLKRTRILDKYSETFMMAGALPGKEKTNTKDNKSRALKYYFFFKNLEATFALFRSPAAEDCGAQTPQSSSSPREFAVLSSDRYRRGVYTGKGKYVMRLSLSPRQLKRFNPIHIQRRRKKNGTHKRLLYIWQQATD